MGGYRCGEEHCARCSLAQGRNFRLRQLLHKAHQRIAADDHRQVVVCGRTFKQQSHQQTQLPGNLPAQLLDL